jgi:hypothetical protein
MGLDQRCAVLNTRIFVIHKTRNLSAGRLGTAKYSVLRSTTVTDTAHRRSYELDNAFIYCLRNVRVVVRTHISQFAILSINLLSYRMNGRNKGTGRSGTVAFSVT